MNRNAAVATMFVLASGCGGSGVPAAKSASVPAAPTRAEASTGPSPAVARVSDPWALPEGPRAPKEGREPKWRSIGLDAWTKAISTKGIVPPTARCSSLGKTAPAAAAKPADREREELVRLLAEKDVAKRDAMLASFEAGQKDDGMALAARALRAMYVPLECADVVADPYLKARKDVEGPEGHLLVELSLSAKFARTGRNPPTMKDASDTGKVKRFIQGPLRTWMVDQATVIDGLTLVAGRLEGTSFGSVAIQAGVADLRLVDQIRNAPVPSGWDAELRAVYEAALDEALEPRKTRGRDALLAGFAEYASDEMIDPRHEDARSLLSKLYGGRRVDALDALLVPGAPRLSLDAHDFVALFAGRRRSRERAAKDLEATFASKGRYRFELGRRYWRRVDFVEAAHASAQEKGDEARLVLALSLTLAHGPNGLREMMTALSPSAFGLDHTEALDVLVAEGGKMAGWAAFDAAYLRSLSPPDGEAAVPYLRDVAERFRKAAALLSDERQKKESEQRAADADAAARAVRAAPQ